MKMEPRSWLRVTRRKDLTSAEFPSAQGRWLRLRDRMQIEFASKNNGIITMIIVLIIENGIPDEINIFCFCFKRIG